MDVDAINQKELVDFLRPHFESSDDLIYFLSDVFDYQNGPIVKRQMLFQTLRFVSLANNIEKISPASDGLKLLFIKICIESLHSLSGGKKDFYEAFCDCFSDEGKHYILNHFKLFSFTDEYRGHIFETSHNITLLDFLYIIKAIRDRIAHDGEHWSMQFFVYDEDVTYFVSMETEDKMIKSYQYHRKNKLMTEYHFETSLNYDRFIYFFVEACINYVRSFFKLSSN